MYLSRGTAEYVRYAFSVVPGTASFLGFLAVIAFLPATMKCKKVGKSSHNLVPRFSHPPSLLSLSLSLQEGGKKGELVNEVGQVKMTHALLVN